VREREKKGEKKTNRNFIHAKLIVLTSKKKGHAFPKKALGGN
jgi:hypothetical protein